MNSIDSDANLNSDDRLPDGGAAKVKARPSGRKDKVVESEICEAEGLPSGWTKELKVKKKGRKIRTDPYYTDPVSGCKFRSMKDARRYIQTGEIGKLAIRPKDKSSNIMGLKDDEACLPAAAKKQKLEVNSSTIQSSKLSKVANDKQVDGTAGTEEVANDKHVLSPASTGQSTPNYMHISGEEGSQSKNSGVLENESSKQKVKANDPDKSEISTTGAARSNENTLDSEAMKDESKRTSTLGKSKEKKNLSVPRRTSKRLSGVPLDPTPELKTTNRACQAAVKQSDNKATCKNTSETSKSAKPSLESCKSKHPTVNLAAEGKVETENMDNKKPESENISASRGQVEKENEIKLENVTVTEDATKIQTDKIGDEKSGFCLDLPLGELCQDPCIAFAIKTLTGISFDNTDTVQVSTGSNSDFGGSLAISEDHTRKDARIGVHTPQADQALNNAVTGLKAEELEVSNNDNGKTGSPLDLSFANVWADPCIEFAIKTLTGAIPLDCDVVLPDSSQNKGSSLQSQGSSGLSMQKIAENGQSRLSCNQAPREFGLRGDKNMNVGFSKGTVCAGNLEDRSRGSQK